MTQYTAADLDDTRSKILKASQGTGRPKGALTAHLEAIRLLSAVATPEK